MKRNPYHFGALSGYGQIYFQQKQYDKAIEYWQRALKVNPNLDLAGNIELARMMLAQGGKSST
jgi:tetratricopeptide (TPR) repeat protein